MEIDPQVEAELPIHGWKRENGTWVMKDGDGNSVFPTFEANEMALKSAVSQIEDRLYSR